MKCPNCNAFTTIRVLDTIRAKPEVILRRRVCLKCRQRFNTVETYEEVELPRPLEKNYSSQDWYLDYKQKYQGDVMR